MIWRRKGKLAHSRVPLGAPLKRRYFVYSPQWKVVLSGYPTKGAALKEAEKVRRELGRKVVVRSRTHKDIQQYASTHPAFAQRESFQTQEWEREDRDPRMRGQVGHEVKWWNPKTLSMIRTVKVEDGYFVDANKLIVGQSPAFTVKTKREAMEYVHAFLREHSVEGYERERKAMEKIRATIAKRGS